jgi:hypothetical protein
MRQITRKIDNARTIASFGIVSDFLKYVTTLATALLVGYAELDGI